MTRPNRRGLSARDPAKQTVPGVSGQLGCRRSGGARRPRRSASSDYSLLARLVKRFPAFLSIPWLLPKASSRLATRPANETGASGQVLPRTPVPGRPEAIRLPALAGAGAPGWGSQRPASQCVDTLHASTGSPGGFLAKFMTEVSWVAQGL